MKFSQTLRVALEAVRLNRMRSALTILGIMIGIASVILTVGLGLGAQQQVKDQIASLGSNLLIVSPGSSTSSSGERSGSGTATTLTRSDAAALTDDAVAPSISAVAPVASSSQSFIAGSTTWTSTVNAITPDWLSVRSRSLASGRFITPADLSASNKVVILGSDTAEELFSGQSPVGRTVTINGGSFTVIGVMDSSGSSSSSTTSDDDMVLMPWTTASAVLATSAATVSTIYIQARDADALSAAYQEADAALSTRHGISASDDADFTITTQLSLVSAATSTDRTMTILLGGIAAISLVVGGIGVMNIMLVSVSERTREIGLRKALGARPSVIRSQFLVEAGSLGLAGGLLGLGIAALGSWLLPRLIDQPVTLAWWAALGSLAVAVGVGLVAGVYPAGRAARLAPIDALRRE
ncbi:Macrolide export ATP-binding/permease protein MacB [Acidipropionibacterium acidipropionici ATCC 4875]|uniref:Macrolide export ATP-binding/permease protein MacB n=1 Tax=Acidipropionibacterium acidipropionici (strain ATCC 4875 / DSM 20272 / JCM 6432 / NBRC 12425 / NCIMB 8070 / 4) TaxID=1171373 RepID=K7RTH2_ACIA4|nr:ABC transporter permease [Acidipropionibacterium acidipropionici]AFV88203.1 Macrolide export ATP-binding/permease protein MacB [Acidipropionibacterium acidipropionici ATCC 4875]